MSAVPRRDRHRRWIVGALLAGSVILAGWWFAMVTAQVVVPDPVAGGSYSCGTAAGAAWIHDGGYRGGERLPGQDALDVACETEAEEVLELTWVPVFPAAAAALVAGTLCWSARREPDRRRVDASVRFARS